MLSACGDALGPRARPGGETPTEAVDSGLLNWYQLDPRVVVPNGNGNVRITAKLSQDVPARVVLRSGSYDFERVGSLNVVTVKEAELLESYRAGDLHHVAGKIQVGTPAIDYNLVVNVLAAGVPSVPTVALAAGVKGSAHVINLRTDSIYGGRSVPPALVRDVYGYIHDEYDFMLVVEAVRSPKNRLFTGVRNQITGIGVARFDQGQQYGSTARLEGIVNFPNDDFFDLAETSTMHELAHRWMNYTHVPALATAAPHWPLSDLAYGIMGRSDPVSHQSSSFPYQVVPQTNGTFLTRRIPLATEFNDLELYLIGLLPPDSVQPHIVFRDQSQVSQLRPDGTLNGPVDTVRVTDVIAREGARVPQSSEGLRNFNVATVVLSRDRLLTPTEMAFYDYMALRGEAETVLPYTLGNARGDTKPFYLATGQRARLRTTLRY